MLGKTILVGITYEDKTGKVLSRKQFYGIITAFDETGIEIALQGKNLGKTYRIPPDMRAIHPAKPGEYALKDSDEVVVDPDFISTWISTSP